MTFKPYGWKNLPSHETPLDTAELNKAEEALYNAAAVGISATTFSGVDATGATDSTVGLETAIKETRIKEQALNVPPGKYKIGARGTGIEFKNCWPERAGGVFGFELNCSAGAVFEGSAALGSNPVIQVGPPTETDFVGFYLKFGAIKTTNKKSIGIKFTGLGDSYVYIGELKGTAEPEASDAIVCDATVQPTYVGGIVGNNEFHIGSIREWGYGLVLVGSENPKAPNIQVSGNLFFISEIITCANYGINVDSLGPNHNSEWNSFYIGDIELCTQGAILDQNGNNRYICGSLNANGSAFELAEKALEKSRGHTLPYVRVSAEEGEPFKLNEQPADVVNLYNSERGWVPLKEVNANFKTKLGLSKVRACAVVDGVVTLSASGEVSPAIVAGAKLALVPVGARPQKIRKLTGLYTSTAAEVGQGVEVTLAGNMNTIAEIKDKTTITIECSYPIRVTGE